MVFHFTRREVILSPTMAPSEHIDKDTFKQIFRDHWDAFKAAYPQFATPDYDLPVLKMLDCGDPEKMGYAQYRCTYCGDTRRIAFTCKSAFCLSCAKPYTDRWVDFIGRRLLPGVTYRHIVLTVPDFLHLWFFCNPILLSHLMRAGYAFLVDIFSTCARTPLDIGSIVVLQTAGRPGTFNPHLHILVTGGGLTSHGRWKPVSYIPFDMVHRKWQYHLLSMLRKCVSDPAVLPNIDRAWKEYPNGLVAFVEKGDVPPGGKGLARYLAKYVVSPPISINRIENYDGHTVRYWYRDHRTQAIEHTSQPVLRFIGRMVQHILPKGFQRIRYYGLHGNVRYAGIRETIKQLLPANLPEDPRGYRVLPRKSFAQTFLDTFGKDPLLCPRCLYPMELELLYNPKYGTIKEFLISSCTDGWPDERYPTSTVEATAGRFSAVDRAQHVVQLSLPFL
jgi:hypothetical protein